MKKFVNGVYLEQTEADIRSAELLEKSRPMTADEITRLFLSRNIHTLISDDATASRAVAYHPQMRYDGALIPAKTRINWNGSLKRAAVDLWDREENSPDNAPALWEDVAYRDGIRIIPEVITATSAFSRGEYGWWKGRIYLSVTGGNVYTPEVYPANWEAVEA